MSYPSYQNVENEPEPTLLLQLEFAVYSEIRGHSSLAFNNIKLLSESEKKQAREILQTVYNYLTLSERENLESTSPDEMLELIAGAKPVIEQASLVK